MFGMVEMADEMLSSIRCRAGITEPVPGLGVLVTMSVMLERPTPEGFHDPEEGQAVNAFGEGFSTAAGRAGLLVGSVCAKGAKHFFVYASSTGWAEQWERRVRPETTRRFGVRTEQDAAWSWYFHLAEQCRYGVSDLQLYNQLQKVDNDLSRPRRVDWVFLYGSEERARQARGELGSMGFTVSVLAGDDGTDWVVTASSVEPLPLAYVVHMSAQSRLFAARTGGRYDGWGTEVADPRTES